MTHSISFLKMQGLQNDFVIIDEQNLQEHLSIDQIKWIADRRNGIGCDQFIIMKPSDKADVAVDFYNADGQPAKACGNGTRCVARAIGKERGLIETPSYISKYWNRGEDISISLKEPVFGQTVNQPPPLGKGYLVNVGNPHIVFFVENLDSVPLEKLAPEIQPPGGINVEIVEAISSSSLKVKIWERGVGITPACGSGACAAALTSIKLWHVQEGPIQVEMDGGSLTVEWNHQREPIITGPAKYCFEGTFELP